MQNTPPISFPCDEHPGELLHYVLTEKSPRKRLLCRRCLVRDVRVLDHVRLIDEFIDERLLQRSFDIAPEQLEKQASAPWLKHAADTSNRLTKLLDQFKQIVEELQNRVQTEINAINESFHGRVETFLFRRSKYLHEHKINELNLTDPSSLQAFIETEIEREQRTSAQHDFDKEEIVKEYKSLKEGSFRHENYQHILDFFEHAERKLEEVRKIFPKIEILDRSEAVQVLPVPLPEVQWELRFSDTNKHNGMRLAPDRKTISAVAFSGIACLEIDLTKLTAPIKWKVKRNGAKIFGVGLVKLGSARKVNFHIPNTQCLILASNSNVYYQDSGALGTHNLDFSSGEVEVLYDPTVPKIVFMKDGKLFEKTVADKEDLVACVYLNIPDSISVTQLPL
eukprot:TRINITY_DN4850_c0_g1_i2.p2 TRINITY_DN4850_c0_g1~~TRINITY_DN4850_c0_g1_i2.p2  ORF type:complete len:394 (+),score=94.43 TRINITY_DN4850_c0_g1_i2:1420-2601(+)